MYKTIATACSAEFTIQKSRFITFATPIDSEAQAKIFIDKIKKEHWRATHCVPVYLIGNPCSIERYSDDGEPSGTAGVPILTMLKSEGITDICLVVVRYFGGIKLGTGGLVRAYTAAAKAAIIDRLVTVDRYNCFECSYDYHHHGKIEYFLTSIKAYVTNSEFTEKVKLQFYVSNAQEQKVKEQLNEITGGTITQKNRLVYGYLQAGHFEEIE